jgi:hypothetical protein
LDLRGRKWRETGEDYVMRSFITCTVRANVIRVINSRRMRWARHVARMGKIGKEYKILVEKPDEKRALGRPRRRWEA